MFLHVAGQCVLPVRAAFSTSTLNASEEHAIKVLFDRPPHYHSVGLFHRDPSSVDRTTFGYPLTVMRSVDLSDAVPVGGGAEWSPLIVPAAAYAPESSDGRSDTSARDVDAACDATPSWTVVNASDLMHLFSHGSAIYESGYMYVRKLRKVLERVLPRVHLRGKPVAIEQIVPWGYTFFSSPAFPIVHRDFQWSSFGDAAGFQVWCLVGNHAPTRHGNLVLIKHEEAPTEHKHPVYFAWDDEAGNGTSKGRLLKLNHITNELHEQFDGWQDARTRFEYPDLKPGQCIVMHRAHLHASDPRPAVEPKHEAVPPSSEDSSLAAATARHPARAHTRVEPVKPVRRTAVTMRFVVLPTATERLRVWLGNGFAKRYLFAGDKSKAPCSLHPRFPGWCTLQPNFTTFIDTSFTVPKWNITGGDKVEQGRAEHHKQETMHRHGR